MERKVVMESSENSASWKTTKKGVKNSGNGANRNQSKQTVKDHRQLHKEKNKKGDWEHRKIGKKTINSIYKKIFQQH